MKTRIIAWLALSAVLLSSPGRADDHAALKAFPPAEEGMQRLVIVLPHKERGEEDAFKVELIAGKQMETDGVNLYRSGAQLAAEPLKGWGYTYYVVKGIEGPVASTLMAPPPGTPKQTKFVSGDPLLIRYNSRLPIVIYAPQGAEVRYRIWQAPEELRPAKEG